MVVIRILILLLLKYLLFTHGMYQKNLHDRAMPIASIGLSLFKGDPLQDWQPQQIHLSFGDSFDTIIVTWLTINDTDKSTVLFGVKNLNETKTNTPSKFTDSGSEHRVMWIHRVYLDNLQHDTRYVYQCGSNKGWSELFSFKTRKGDTEEPIHVAMYGDLGVVNPQSLSRLQLEAERGLYDAIIHVGDMAYDMDTDNSRLGDQFMQMIQPIAAYLPYMVCPGNHENAYNFSNYRARFTMPMFEKYDNMFYSWNLGPVHFISINTEAFYYLNYGIKPVLLLHKWLLSDLKEATKPEIRSERPWIIMYGHRPMYCSNRNFDDCTRKTCLVRIGYPFFHWLGLENILAEYGVDLAIWAHEHSFERLWPIYDYKVLNGSTEEPYRNPGATVHMTTGSAGCKEKIDNFKGKRPYWSAFRSTDYGYSRLRVMNKTHLHMEQVSDDQDGKVIDSFLLVREKHEPFPHLVADNLLH